MQRSKSAVGKQSTVLLLHTSYSIGDPSSLWRIYSPLLRQLHCTFESSAQSIVRKMLSGG